MTRLRVSLALAPLVFAAALAAATAASSRSHAGGISVRALPVEYALDNVDTASGISLYTVVAEATWSPPAPATEGAFYIKNLDDGGTQVMSFGQSAAERTYETWSGSFPAYAGARYLLTAKWRVYVLDAFDGADGTAQSPPVTLKVPMREPVPRFTDATKRKLEGAALAATVVSQIALIAAMCCPVPALFVIAGVGFVATSVLLYLARDPVDLNFRSVAKPAIPAVPEIRPGAGISAAAADALTRLLGAQAREIGLGRAMLTAFNRSQGAFVKKQPVWERKQMLAAGRYAAELATALLADASARPQVRSALAGSPLDTPVRLEDVEAAWSEIVRRGMPSQLTGVLSKLGLPVAGQKQIRARVLGYDAGRQIGSPADALAGVELLRSLRSVAADLKAFSKKAARDPLHTGQ